MASQEGRTFLDKFINKEKAQKLTVADPREVFNNVLKQASGAYQTRTVKFDIFYQITAFKGVAGGVGTSTLVANTALAIAELGVNVCVIDTSILYPVQDLLLKTNYDDIQEKDRLDWFDMPFTKKSPLHVSRLSNKISVLSFYGKNRGITDILSTNDNEALVDMALTELHNKFDIILIDSCNELTNINTSALQLAQQVIQVWSSSNTAINNIDNFITNQVTLACPLDKMRYVVYSKMNRDVIGSIDSILEQYRLKKLADIPLSRDIDTASMTEKQLWQCASNVSEVIEYTDEVIKVALHILNVKMDDEKKPGSFTANDIMNGNVQGTVHQKLAQQAANMPQIATTMQQANAQLQQWNQGQFIQNQQMMQQPTQNQQPMQNQQLFQQPMQGQQIPQQSFGGGSTLSMTPQQQQALQQAQEKYEPSGKLGLFGKGK